MVKYFNKIKLIVLCEIYETSLNMILSSLRRKKLEYKHLNKMVPFLCWWNPANVKCKRLGIIRIWVPEPSTQNTSSIYLLGWDKWVRVKKQCSTWLCLAVVSQNKWVSKVFVSEEGQVAVVFSTDLLMLSQISLDFFFILS